ncbi:MAG: 3-phosphoshikimate 1-carboxyvinyltransferase [Candidatus Bathyarchaeia archaeon]
MAIVRHTCKLEGCISAPPSKSYTHRSLIAAMLAKETIHIRSPLLCEDTEATIRACKSLGAYFAAREDSLVVRGPLKLKAPDVPIDCGESGSTMRFMIPIAALAEGTSTLTGAPSLLRRPVGPLVDALRDLGVHCISRNGYPPVVVNGRLVGGRTSIVGDVSSQFITGLLLACPLAEEDTELNISTPLESKPYVRLTLNILRRHGIVVNASADLQRFHIPGQQTYSVTEHKVPGDYSSAAFMMAAASMIGSTITIRSLDQEPDQPDSEIISILKSMGAKVQVKAGSVEVEGGNLKAADVDCRDTPDLVPVVAALGCKASGSTRITGVERLRFKESDRLASITELRKFGVELEEAHGNLTVKAPPVLKGAEVNSHNDHRIAMACTIVGLSAENETRIKGAESVAKSYPKFFEDLIRLGGNIDLR